MNFNKIFVAVIASLLFASGAYAENKTSVTDILNVGESRVDLDYGYSGLSINGAVSSSTTSFDFLGKTTVSRLSAAYLFGVTDRLNMGILFGLSNGTSETSYTYASNSYLFTSKLEGANNPVISAQYLLSDKRSDQTGLVVFGSFSPAAAATDEPVSQVETNGVVTTAGITGKSAHGYATSNIGATVSTPVTMGDVFARFEYIVYGEGSTSGGTAKNGAIAAMQLGLESKVGNSAKVRPYVRVFSTGSGYSGTSQLNSHVDYSLGLEGIKDESKSVSISVTGEYILLSQVESSTSAGSKSSYSGKAYLLGVRGMFFF